MADAPSRLVWLDLEMTGLDLKKDVILEIATVVTDTALNILAEGPSLAIHHSDEILANMHPWCVRQHQISGLTERVRHSRISLAEAEARTLAFIKTWVGEQQSPLCGNSICTDRRFLAVGMPTLEAYFHYRLLDVSSVKILAQMWKPKMPMFEKSNAHLALGDVLESIAELRYYRQAWLNPDEK